VFVATKGGVDAPRVEAVEDSDGGTTPAPCCADVWPVALENWPPVSSKPTDSSSSSPSFSLSSSDAPAFADNVAKLSLGTEDGRDPCPKDRCCGRASSTESPDVSSAPEPASVSPGMLALEPSRGAVCLPGAIALVWSSMAPAQDSKRLFHWCGLSSILGVPCWELRMESLARELVLLGSLENWSGGSGSTLCPGAAFRTLAVELVPFSGDGELINSRSRCASTQTQLPLWLAIC